MCLSHLSASHLDGVCPELPDCVLVLLERTFEDTFVWLDAGGDLTRHYPGLGGSGFSHWTTMVGHKTALAWMMRHQ